MRRQTSLLLLAAVFTVCPWGAACLGAAARVNAAPGRHPVRLILAAPSVVLNPRTAEADAPKLGETALSAWLAFARDGSVIRLRSGFYRQIDDYAQRTGWVTVSGVGDATPPIINGALLRGAQYVRFVGVKFSSRVFIDRGFNAEFGPLASHIAILNSVVDCGDTTTSGQTGVLVRGASWDIALRGDWIHNCVVGFMTQAQDQRSLNISLTHDTFSDFPGDAIDLGGVDHVVIANDVIKNIADPAGVYHDDGVQFFGNTNNVAIVDNVLSNSRSQLVFIQDAVAGTASGVRSNTNILVAHNLIYGDGGVAIQDQGGINVSFVGNTIWSCQYGCLWLRSSSFSGQEPVDTVITDNIVDGFALFNGAEPTVESHNLIVDGPKGYRYGSGDEVNLNPLFVDAAVGDFQLRPNSRARDHGAALGLLSDGLPILRDLTISPDLYGDVLGPSISIGALQPTDPAVSYGAPRYPPKRP